MKNDDILLRFINETKINRFYGNDITLQRMIFNLYGEEMAISIIKTHIKLDSQIDYVVLMDLLGDN